RKKEFAHRDPHLRRDVHVDVLVEALPSAGDEVVEAHELAHERVDGLLVADEIHRVAEGRAQHDALGELTLLYEALVRELLRAAAAQRLGRGRPDLVAHVAGDVAEEDGLVGRANLGAAAVPGLGEAVEGLVREVDRLRWQRLWTVDPQPDAGG